MSGGASSSAESASAAAAGVPVPAGAKYVKRKQFTHGGRTIYEWEQDIEQVDMWITPPPGVTAKMIDCVITDRHMRIGIKGNPPFIDVRNEKRRERDAVRAVKHECTVSPYGSVCVCLPACLSPRRICTPLSSSMRASG